MINENVHSCCIMAEMKWMITFGTIPNTGDDYKTGKDKLTAHFKQSQNSDLEEIKSRRRNNEGETYTVSTQDCDKDP